MPRPEDGCLLAFTFRSVAAGGRAVCRLVRRAVASPSFGSYEAGDPLQVWAGRVLPMWTRATRRQALGFQAAGGMASGLVAGGRSDEGRMGRRQSITGRPLCWRQDEAAAVCQVAIRVPGFLLEAAGNSPSSRRLQGGGVQPSVRMRARKASRGREEAQQRANGLGLCSEAQQTTQTVWRPAESGPGVKGEAGGEAVWPEAPTRERCAASSSEARRWGRHGSVVGRNPFPLYCPTRRRLSRATALGGAQAVELSELSDMNDRQSGDAAAFGDGQGGGGFCPSVQTDAPAANQKAAGAASCCCLLLSVVRPLGWMKAGWCVPVSGCLRWGLPWQGWITI